MCVVVTQLRLVDNGCRKVRVRAGLGELGGVKIPVFPREKRDEAKVVMHDLPANVIAIARSDNQKVDPAWILLEPRHARLPTGFSPARQGFRHSLPNTRLPKAGTLQPWKISTRKVSREHWTKISLGLSIAGRIVETFTRDLL